jgi:hypothetical protein
VEGAQQVAALLPQSTLVAVPGIGHSVLGSDLTPCSDRALQAFFAAKPIQTRCRPPARIRPDGPIPDSLRDLNPVVANGARGRTVSAAVLTVFDVLEQSADSLLSDPFGLIRGGGLRGGRYFETRKSIALRNVVYIPGVRVSGQVGERGTATLTVAGSKASRGQIHVRGARVTGVLGGRRVNGRFRSLAEPARAFAAASMRHRAR